MLVDASGPLFVWAMDEEILNVWGAFNRAAVEEGYDKADMRAWQVQVFKRLTLNELVVVLGMMVGLTQAEMGEVLGVDRTAVTHRLEAALGKIRRQI